MLQHTLVLFVSMAIATSLALMQPTSPPQDFSPDCQTIARPPNAGTYPNCGSNLGCLPRETNVTVWAEVPPGDYQTESGIPPCDNGGVTPQKLKDALKGAVAAFSKDPNAAQSAQPITDQLATRIDEELRRQGGTGSEILDIILGRQGRYAACKTLAVIIPSGFRYRGVVLYAEDDKGRHADDLLGHAKGCGDPYWGGWGYSVYDSVIEEHRDDGTSIAAVQFRNWSHNMIRRVAVSFFLTPR